MPRKIKNARIDSRSARDRLPIRPEPYFARIGKGRYLGYRKGPGTWIARFRDSEGKQHYKSLGIADDVIEVSDPEEMSFTILRDRDVLTFDQAQVIAGDWFQGMAAGVEGSEKGRGAYTVNNAIEDYKKNYVRRGGKSLENIERNIDAHILPSLGKIPVAKLRKRQIEEWHHKLAETPARVRTKPGKEQKYRDLPDDDQDAKRARRSTANKVLTMLKAALNYAHGGDRFPNASAWQAVKPFQKVDVAKVQYLTDDEALRLVNACPPDLRALVTAALLTGCRYGELIRLKTSNLNIDNGTIYIADSKSGKPRHVYLTDEANSFFERAGAGLNPNDLVFTHDDGRPWKSSQQARPIRQACEAAEIEPCGFHVLRHTYGSRLAMRGVSMQVIAQQLGHADTRITEKHYAHLSPSYVAETVRAAFGTLGIVEADNVTSVKIAR